MESDWVIMDLVDLQMKKQLEDVVHVAVVNILTRGKSLETNLVERDLMLAKVSTTRTWHLPSFHLYCMASKCTNGAARYVIGPGSRAEVVELASLFDAKVIDVRQDQVMLQVAGAPGRIEALLGMLTPLGVTEIHRSGVIAMARSSNVADSVGELTLEDATERIMQDADDEVDLTRLPPG